jgi:hypothetical protein
MLATATVAQSRARSNSAPLPGKVKLNLRCTRQKPEVKRSHARLR